MNQAKMMIKIKNIISISCLILLANSAFAGGDFYKEKYRGWYWFESKEKKLERERKETKAQNEVKKDKNLALLEKMSQELEEKKAALVVRPSVENAKNYIEAQTRMFDTADEVTRVWQAALLKYPHLNPRIDSPINQQAINIKRQSDEEQNAIDIKEFAKEYGLIFFFKSDCKYCHAFADVLKKFVETYDFSIEAISLDGGEIANFSSKQDNNLVSKLEISVTPTLMAYSPSQNKIFPIAHGFMSFDELKTNTLFVVNLLSKHKAENAQNNIR